MIGTPHGNTLIRMARTVTGDQTPVVRIRGGFNSHGAFGPAILLVLSSPDAVNWFKRLLLGLANGDGPVELAGVPGVELHEVHRLELRPVRGLTNKHLLRSSDGSFDWIGESGYWLWSAKQVEALENHTGHQYLTREDIDDALVEVSFGERHAGLTPVEHR